MAQLTTQQLLDNADTRQPNNATGAIDAVDTREQSKDVAESSVNKITDASLLGLRLYDVSKTYEIGESTIHDNGGGLQVWNALAQTSGVFAPASWSLVGGSSGGDTLSLDAQSGGLTLSGSNPQILALAFATAAIDGSLKKEDFATFAAKQDALGFNAEDQAQKGAASGYCPLTALSKIDPTFLPDSIVGSLNYQGTWNATTNAPSLSDATGAKGEYYVVSVSGTQDLGRGPITFSVGDWAIHNDTAFELLDNSLGAVSWGDIIGDISENIALTAELGKKIEDAPTDGKQYAREGAGWTEVPGPGPSYSFNNGLENIGGVVGLGGTLTGDTVLNGVGNSRKFEVVNLASFKFNTGFDTLTGGSNGLVYNYSDNYSAGCQMSVTPGALAFTGSFPGGGSSFDANSSLFQFGATDGSDSINVRAAKNDLVFGAEDATDGKYLIADLDGFILSLKKAGEDTGAKAAFDIRGDLAIETVEDAAAPGDNKFLILGPDGTIKKATLPDTSSDGTAVDNFETETSSFTVGTNKRKSLIDCNFTTAGTVTIEDAALNTGEILYLSQTGDEIFSLIEGAGVTIELNLSQALDSAGKGDTIAILKKGPNAFKLV